MSTTTNEFAINCTVNCTGDVVAGDTIRFSEGIFCGGSFGRFRRAPRHVGDRTITATVLRESYGADKQQHTFTLNVIACEGVQPLAIGTRTTRKGRNIYRHGTARMPWADESLRGPAADEKHGRGDRARAARDARKAILL